MIYAAFGRRGHSSFLQSYRSGHGKKEKFATTELCDGFG